MSPAFTHTDGYLGLFTVVLKLTCLMIFRKSALGRRGILNLTVGSGEGGECKEGMQASASSPMEKVPQLWGHASFLLPI